MGHGGDGRVIVVERNGGNVGDAGAEAGEDVLLGDVQDAGVEGRVRIVDLEDVKAVLKGADVQHRVEDGLGLADLDAVLQEGHFGGDFNHTTVDVGGDGEGLEEGGIFGSQGGRLGSLDGVDQVTGLLEIAIGHDGADVLLGQWQKVLQRSNFHQKLKNKFSRKSRSSSLGGALDGMSAFLITALRSVIFQSLF